MKNTSLILIMIVTLLFTACTNVVPNSYATFQTAKSIQLEKNNSQIEASLKNLSYKQFQDLCLNLTVPSDLLYKIGNNDKIVFCSEDITGIDTNSFRLLFENSMISHLLSKNINVYERNPYSLYNIFNEKKNLAFKFNKMDSTFALNNNYPTINSADKILSYSVYNSGQLTQIESDGNHKRIMHLDLLLKLIDVNSGRILYCKTVETTNQKVLSESEIQLVNSLQFSQVELPYPFKSGKKEGSLIKLKDDDQRNEIVFQFKRGTIDTKVVITDDMNEVKHSFTIPKSTSDQIFFQYNWNLNDNTGNKIPAGEYNLKTLNQSSFPIKVTRVSL
ncbi:MAG TPA: hypothetical protein PKJ08_08440 [Candidatus Cloacimonadota bacterium]|nr:hypothetical protein [Candidatus Cloacimonadota bacterium]